METPGSHGPPQPQATCSEERINLKNDVCVSPRPNLQETGPCADKARRRRSFGLTGTDPSTDISDFPSGERLQVSHQFSLLHAMVAPRVLGRG